MLLVAAIARRLWPGRRRIELGAAAFVAFLPVVVETTAMFHPEPLSLLLSTLALYFCVRAFADPRYAWALGITLGAAQLVRAWALATVAAVAIALLAGRRFRVARDRARARRADPGAVVHPPASQVRRPAAVHAAGAGPPEPLGQSFYLDPGIPGIVTLPTREHHYAQWIPTTYDGIWGDYFGVWALARGTPTPRVSS